VLRPLTLVALALAAALAVSVSAAAGSPAAPARFPVTITTPTGKVTVSKRPTRVVSLSPTATESLFAMGAGPQVVAVDDQSDHPRNAPKTSLSGFTPNVEAIASYRPDLVVTSYNPRGLVESLTRLRIPVIFHDAPKSFAGAYQQIRQLGLVTGRTAGASRVIRTMKTRIGRVIRAARGKAGRLSVYHELTPDFFSASSKSFVGQVYSALGLENIADEADSAGTGFPQLSAEYIVASSPDVIVLADSICCGQKPSTVASRPGWERINAVRTGSVVSVHDSVASRWGPRLVSFFRALSAALARL
jgi:iron complex transport system substrate-binding protein